MDPAMPDWRAFGQPVAATPTTPANPDGPAARPSVVELLARLPRTTRIALAVAAVVAVGGLGLALTTPSGGEVALDDTGVLAAAAHVATDAVGGPAVPAAELVVDVAGAVARPGLIRLAAGSRVGDAVAAAGGYAPTADLGAAARDLNLAAPLTDGAKVLVPALSDGIVAAGPASAGSGSGGAGGRLDLNAATQAELEDLPGIGPVTAGRILEARAEAPFATVDELRSRGLVGDSVFTKLRDLVTAGS